MLTGHFIFTPCYQILEKEIESSKELRFIQGRLASYKVLIQPQSIQ